MNVLNNLEKFQTYSMEVYLLRYTAFFFCLEIYIQSPQFSC